MNRLVFLTLSTVLAAAATGAGAKPLKWMDAAGAGLPAGAKMAVVKGDPGKAGDFTVQIKMPAKYTVPPHQHPADETVRVLGAGKLATAWATRSTRRTRGRSTKGYHVTMMANMNHWVSTTDPVDVQVSGTGPFTITYVDPKDDPRTAAK